MPVESIDIYLACWLLLPNDDVGNKKILPQHSENLANPFEELS
jgi:hypothetical protein